MAEPPSLEIGAGAPTISTALHCLMEVQRANGTFGFKLVRGKGEDLDWWICLAVCRSLKWLGFSA